MDSSFLEISKENAQRVYDTQMRIIIKNRETFTATRPYCAQLFDLLYPQEDLQLANPGFIQRPGQTYHLAPNIDEVYRAASLLASDTAFDNAIKLVIAISGKRAEKLETKDQARKKAGGLKTRTTVRGLKGSFESFDYFSSRTGYFASLFALNELKAHQAVHAPNFRWNRAKFDAVLASAEKPMRKIISRNLLVDQYLNIFLIEQIKKADPNAVGNVGIDPLLPSARATLAQKHIEMATANLEYLEELILLDLRKQRENIETSNVTNPHHLKVVKRMQVVFQAAQSLGLEK